MVTHHVPEAGDIVWLNFTLQTGREQSGHRPALVLSPSAYNNKTGLMICCPAFLENDNTNQKLSF
jgi:mRNA interferase MazF